MQLAFQQWPLKNLNERIVLLHGLGGLGALWRPIAARLEDEFTVIAPDQRGHGKSPVSFPASFLPLDYAQDVRETLESIQFFPVWAVGHSMGVRTAVALAHLVPDLVQGLILVDLGFDGLAGGGLGEALFNFLKKLPESFPSRTDAKTYLTQHCPDASMAQYLLAVAIGTTEIRFPFQQEALLRTIESAEGASIREWLHAYASRGNPVLVLRGGKSSVLSAERFEQEREYFKSLPNVVFETFEGVGHGLPFEDRVKFTTRVKEWIHEHSQRS